MKAKSEKEAEAEYKRVSCAAAEEFGRVTGPAYNEYKRVWSAARAGFQRLVDPDERVLAPALAEFERAESAALAEYKRVTAAAKMSSKTHDWWELTFAFTIGLGLGEVLLYVVLVLSGRLQ